MSKLCKIQIEMIIYEVLTNLWLFNFQTTTSGKKQETSPGKKSMFDDDMFGDDDEDEAADIFSQPPKQNASLQVKLNEIYVKMI